MSALTNLVSRFTRGRGTTPATRTTTGRRVAGTRPSGKRGTASSTGAVEGAARKLLRRAR